MTLIARLQSDLLQKLPSLETDETYLSYKKYYEDMKAQGYLIEQGYTLAPFGEPVSQPPQKNKLAAKTYY